MLRLKIISATACDATPLDEIALKAKRHWHYPEPWIESWRNDLSVRPESFSAECVFKAVVRNRVTGFYALFEDGGSLQLEHLWVLPEAMGKGIGRRLFQHSLLQAGTLGHSSILIESDPNAEGFYLRMGARRTGTVVREVLGHRRELPILICSTEGMPN